MVDLHDIIGNLGVAFIVGAYFLLQIGRIRGDDIDYPIANGIGACLVLVSLTFEFNLSAAILEGFWIMISLIGLYRVLKSSQKEAE